MKRATGTLWNKGPRQCESGINKLPEPPRAVFSEQTFVPKDKHDCNFDFHRFIFSYIGWNRHLLASDNNHCWPCAVSQHLQSASKRPYLNQKNKLRLKGIKRKLFILSTYSLLVLLRCQIHTELAKIEEDEEQIQVAMEHLKKVKPLYISSWTSVTSVKFWEEIGILLYM